MGPRLNRRTPNFFEGCFVCSDSSKVRYLKRKFYESRCEEGLFFYIKKDQKVGKSSQLS